MNRSRSCRSLIFLICISSMRLCSSISLFFLSCSFLSFSWRISMIFWAYSRVRSIFRRIFRWSESILAILFSISVVFCSSSCPFVDSFSMSKLKPLFEFRSLPSPSSLPPPGRPFSSCVSCYELSFNDNWLPTFLPRTTALY